MAICERFDSFKLEYSASVNEDVEKIEFAEALELHFDRNLELGSRKSAAQLSLVNLFVKESSELVVNVKDAAHHIICDSAEGDLIQAAGCCAYLNWHRVTPQNGSNRKMYDRKLGM